MRLLATALACVVVAAVGYVIRGYALLHDYQSGGFRDWVSIVLVYGALLVLVGVCAVVAVRGVRMATKALIDRTRHTDS